MDCRTVRNIADSFLSEQLLVETNHEVLRHLETCAACRAELDARRAIRERLRGAFAQSSHLEMRPEFVAEITRSLKAATETTVSRRSLLRSWWTAAAGVLLAAAGGFALRQTRSRSQLQQTQMKSDEFDGLPRVGASSGTSSSVMSYIARIPSHRRR